MWLIGDDLGSNTGYAVASGNSICPKDMPRTWKYWNGNIWFGDPSANSKCQDGPEPDQCLKGSDCDGCSLTVGYNGVTYCCNNGCYYGWINVDPNTDPLCQCGHDNK
jgi:hypothetical protein